MGKCMFSDLIEEAIASHRMRIEGYVKAADLIKELGLEDLIPLCTMRRMYMPTDYAGKAGHPDWTKNSWKKTGAVVFTLSIPWVKKSEARNVVFATGLEMGKSNYLDTSTSSRPDYLVEKWEWARTIKEGKGKGYGYEDRVEIEFYKTAEEGDRVNDCTVKRVETDHPARVSSGLAIVCNKEGKDE